MLRLLTGLTFIAFGHFASESPVLAEKPPSERVGETADFATVVCLPQTEHFVIESEEGLQYHICVSLPDQEPPEAGYPLLIVLDGDAYFAAATELYRLQQRGSALSPAIIVGVGYPGSQRINMERRTLDMTPPALQNTLPPRRGGQAWPQHGGADQFVTFLRRTLKPRLHDQYQIDPEQEAIFGHSFGGLFVMHCLRTAPESFDRYIAASPSLWWNNYALGDINLFQDQKRQTSQVQLLLMVGELELSIDAGPAAALPPTPEKRDFGNTRLFGQKLTAMHLPHIKATFKEFPNENHGSVLPLAINEAIRFALPASP